METDGSGYLPNVSNLNTFNLNAVDCGLVGRNVTTCSNGGSGVVLGTGNHLSTTTSRGKARTGGRGQGQKRRALSNHSSSSTNPSVSSANTSDVLSSKPNDGPGSMFVDFDLNPGGSNTNYGRTPSLCGTDSEETLDPDETPEQRAEREKSRRQANNARER